MTSPLEAAGSLRDALAAQARAAAQAAADAQAAAAKVGALADQAAALAVLLEQGGGDPQTPTPGPVQVPEDANAVRIGDAVYPLAGINPTRDDYPGGRGPDQLVLYRAPTGFTITNPFGTEATVLGGRVAAVVDREATRQQHGVIVPSGGYVLSGHGRARAWLNRHAVKGTIVEVVRLDEPVSTPVIDPAPQGGQGRPGNIAVWAMLWPDSPRFDWAAIPDEVDEVRLSFLVGAGNLVGYGPWDKAGLQAGMRGFLTKRPERFISFSLGGGGQTVSVPSVGGYVDAVLAVERDLFTADGQVFGRFEGGNVDWENRAFRGAGDSIAKVLRALRADRPRFHCTWAPNGSFKADYAAVCRANADVVDALEFQCYDIPNLQYGTVADIYRGMFLAGGDLKPNQLGVAMMIEPGRNDRWTLQQCIDAATRMRQDFGVTQTSFWEAGMRAFPGWAAAMRMINSRG